MTLFGRFWHAVVEVVGWLTISPISEYGLDRVPQVPLGGGVKSVHRLGGVFDPPTHVSDPNKKFECDYSKMKGWEPCSIPENRECWLRHKETGREFNIHTDYEREAPIGITRHYTLNVSTDRINADGLWFDQAVIFNNTFPGPLIEACWGDVSKETHIQTVSMILTKKCTRQLISQ